MRRIGGTLSEKERAAFQCLTDYIDKFLVQQPECNPNKVYSDHVQVKRKIDDLLTVYTCNASFVLMGAALQYNELMDKLPYNEYGTGDFGKSKYGKGTYVSRVGRFTKCNRGSEELLVNALLNSNQGNLLYGSDFFQKFITKEVNQDDGVVICVQESLVGYFIQQPDVCNNKYICICSESPDDEFEITEGSTILIDSNKFQLETKFKRKYAETPGTPSDANITYLGKHSKWNMCDVPARAWSFAVIEKKTKETKRRFYFSRQKEKDKRRYLIINLHGAHPLSDFRKPAYHTDGEFGPNQRESVKNWLNTICKIKLNGTGYNAEIDGNIYNAEIDGNTYNVNDIIVAGDFNDEVRDASISMYSPPNHSLNVLISKERLPAKIVTLADERHDLPDYRGWVRRKMDEDGNPSNIMDNSLYSLLSRDVHYHDNRMGISNIFPTNGHLAKEKETRAAVDMIWHIHLAYASKSNRTFSEHNMEPASSELPKVHYMQTRINTQSGFNQLYFPNLYEKKDMGHDPLDMKRLSDKIAETKKKQVKQFLNKIGVQSDEVVNRLIDDGFNDLSIFDLKDKDWKDASYDKLKHFPLFKMMSLIANMNKIPVGDKKQALEALKQFEQNINTQFEEQIREVDEQKKRQREFELRRNAHYYRQASDYGKECPQNVLTPD